jgi:hypothetical protein
LRCAQAGPDTHIKLKKIKIQGVVGVVSLM